MSATRSFAIVYTPESAKAVARYVVRGFFGPRELPQALARMVLTGEFARFVGIPVVLLIAARMVPEAGSGWDGGMAAPALTLIAVAWLIAGLLRISRYGPSSGIGCYLVEPDGTLGALAGGLRMRLERRQRRIWIAGLLVEPQWRGARVGTALMRAAFRLAQAEAASGPVTVSVFAPSHPASRAIIARHLGGVQAVEVAEPPAEALQKLTASLDAALKQSGAVFQWNLSTPEQGLFQKR